MRSCDVAPALAAAMHTIAPTHSAIGWYTSPVQPKPTKIRQVAISVAMVMPEIGFDEMPMSPTMRLATVTKKKPKTTISRPSSSLLPRPEPGTNGSTAMISDQRAAAEQHEGDRQIALGALACRGAAAPARSDARLSRNDETIVGSVLSSVMKPPAATAPAPIWRT